MKYIFRLSVTVLISVIIGACSSKPSVAPAIPQDKDVEAKVEEVHGAERMLCNRNAGCSFHGVDFNRHNRAHLLRAAQEGIVFSFCYGIEIMEQMGMKVDRIHAGLANMFLSPIFRDTLAGTSGAVIELYDTDGAAGAARGTASSAIRTSG